MNALPTVTYPGHELDANGLAIPNEIRFTGGCKRKSCKAKFTMVLRETKQTVGMRTRYRVSGEGFIGMWCSQRPVLIQTACACGRTVSLQRVCGVFTDHECGHMCLHAKGGDCECSCGGKNHGAGNANTPVKPTLVLPGGFCFPTVAR